MAAYPEPNIQGVVGPMKTLGNYISPLFHREMEPIRGRALVFSQKVRSCPTLAHVDSANCLGLRSLHLLHSG